MSDTTRKKVVVQRGLWFEEFETAVLYQHRPGRTITEADNVLFTTLTMNTQALHLDAHVRQVVATDISARAVEILEFNAALAGSDWQVRRGSLFEPVADLGDGPYVQLWPHRHGTDAMFCALLRK